ncbi:MAG: LysR family transcriptional regulator, partial [Paracoccaceae bacterium]|nr:LysR family transcriptional regulator [Paracoccaceae bacterium]
MAKSLPPLTWFRAFEAAARRLSFTAAADEIGMTQSAVSQHVKALETRLGTSLFTRQARGLSLTDSGRRLLPQVGAALEKLADATQGFEPKVGENLLTVATSVSVSHWIIAPKLSAFHKVHPEIAIRFLSAIWPDDFNTARADVEIRFGSEKQVGKNALLLTPNRLVALKSPKLDGNIEDLQLIEA